MLKKVLSDIENHYVTSKDEDARVELHSHEKDIKSFLCDIFITIIL